MKEYVLEIETKNRIKRISNPRKVREISLVFTTIIQIMDETGKWRYIGTCPYLADVEIVLCAITFALMSGQEYINLDPMLS